MILLAEDDQLVRNLVENVLTPQGYTLLCAENGAEALEISRNYPGEIQLLLSDVKMPKMDGLELSRHIVRERPGTKVLLMSGRLSGEVPDTGHDRQLSAKTISGEDPSYRGRPVDLTPGYFRRPQLARI